MIGIQKRRGHQTSTRPTSQAFALPPQLRTSNVEYPREYEYNYSKRIPQAIGYSHTT